MNTALRVLAAVLIAGAIGFWCATGAHRGWSKTSVPVKTLDEVTGIAGISYEHRFVPGVDFLVLTAAASAVLGGASVLFRKKSKQPTSITTTAA